MANAAAPGGKQSGEVIKFIILILFMTSGGLALMSAVFWMFLIPGRDDRLQAQTTDSNKLVELLERKNNAKTHIWDTRRNFIEATKNPSTKSLRQIVEDHLGSLQSSLANLPATQDHKKDKTTESVQPIDLKDASLGDILRFAAEVKQENPTVQIGHINLTRRARVGSAAPGGADDDKWTAKIEFYTYSTATGGPPNPAAKTAAPTEEPEAAAPEATPPEAPAEK